MKRLFLILIVLLAAFPAMAQNEREAVDPTAFKVDVNHMNPLRFPSKVLTDSYSVEVRNDSVEVHLPYYGQRHSVSFNTDGLHFKEPITVQKLKTKNKKKAVVTDLTFRARHKGESYTFHINVWGKSTASLDVKPDNGDVCSYSGDVVNE
jgi:hypothetical protein